MRRMTNALVPGLAVCFGLIIVVLSAPFRTFAVVSEADSGATVGASVALPGFENPPEVSWNPCKAKPHTQYVTRRTPLYKTDQPNVKALELDILPQLLGIPIYAVYGDGTGGFVKQSVFDATVKTHVRYFGWCMDPISLERLEDSVIEFWVPLVSQELVVPALYAQLSAYLKPPEVSFPSADPAYGWLYVNAPMDVRIETPDAVSLTATVTNVTGSVTATVTATPSAVTFDSGEPGGGTVPCGIDVATASYSQSSPGGCSYTYQHSSAISPGNEFGTRTILKWEVTTSSPTFQDHAVPTVAYDAVAVASAQSLVTCTGSRPEQGGC